MLSITDDFCFKFKLRLKEFFVHNAHTLCKQKYFCAKLELRSYLCYDEYSFSYSTISSFCRNDNIEKSLDSYRNAFDIVYLVS